MPRFRAAEGDEDVIRNMAEKTLDEIKTRCEHSRLVPEWKTKRHTPAVEDLMAKIYAW